MESSQYLINLRNRYNKPTIEEPPTPKELTQPFYHTAQDLLARLEQLKQLGNDSYAKHDMWFAISYYSLALQCYDQHLQHSDTINNIASSLDEMTAIKKLASIIASNLSLSLNKQTCTPDAVTAAQMAIDFDPTNVKAIIRLATSLTQLGKLEQAITHLRQGLVIATNAQSTDLQTHIKKVLDDHELQQKSDQVNTEYIKSKIAKDRTFEQFPIKMVWEGSGPNGGRKMVASKEVPKGTVMLRVAPFAAAIHDGAIENYCSSCYKALQYNHRIFNCMMCGRKLCGTCQYDDVVLRDHAEACSYFSRPSIHETRGYNMPTQIEVAVRTALRAVQNLDGNANKQSTPTSWRKDGKPFIYDSFEDMKALLNESHSLDHDEEAEYLKWANNITNKLNKKKGASFLARLDNQFILNMLRRMVCNVIEMTDLFQQTPVGFGIFPSAAFINKRCVANVNSYLDNYGMMVYRSNQAIRAGEEVTQTNYDPLLPMWQRRQRMIKEYNQYCECTRCATFEDREHRCPKCGQAVGKRNISIWEPQPSVNFDGRVYLCSKGHATMTAIYNVLEKMVDSAVMEHDALAKVTIPKYIQKDGLMWNKFQRELCEYHTKKSRIPEMTQLTKSYIALHEATLGRNAKDIIPSYYTANYLAMTQMLGHFGYRKEIEDNYRQFRKHLEDTIQLSTHYARDIFDDVSHHMTHNHEHHH
ncbi:hypothetical protein SAMD00019534_049290 [Acytostelium subglobosum LB1]|uniref:hypothetical protein n=1 Tax=Acytostelium subglobosum LB1 TaxID=1410327 RepID=UPI0006450C4F|nr:hypothetical protein SAMD00019534_049290 [Acytostelium subglobosum LB1]GAM21754.1 hypothetical protein SAMD00019534_049290 [Acytostelium subglobosum LB1]|eukprot:XP_012754854.1 hypothetical protein SAMD00019534_049290 [Acytostelium subglobosum LB1]